MIILLSPAKSLDFETEIPTEQYTQPIFMDQSLQLMAKLRNLSAKQIGKMMSISPALAELNHERFASWTAPFKPSNAKPALFVFRGDVYRGLNAATFSKEDITYAQEHLRILSGLHGILKPLDLIQPYRLEMGTPLLVTKAKNNLYKYWGDTVTKAVNRELEGNEDPLVVNLASNEYFKVIQPKLVTAKIISPQFRDFKNGEYKSIMTYAKIARGLMTSYIIRNKITEAEDMKGFNSEGYAYNEQLTKGNEWVFTRD